MQANTLHTYKYWLLAASLLLLTSACEDVINIDIAESEPTLVVDGWLTNQPGEQRIRLTQTQSYLINSFNPTVTGATVRVTDSEGTVFEFADQGEGNYVWEPTAGEVLGQIGRSYLLQIETDGEQYEARTAINRVPEPDSISIELREAELGQPEGLYAQYYARDLPGTGDCYWIRTYKNGTFLNKAEELIIAYDASFSAGASTDGITFIRPLREGVNPIPDEEESDNDVPPYATGDEIRVDLYSITEDAFFYMQQVQIQTVNGGLFAVPAANIRGNVFPTDPSNTKEVQGWFGASAVSTISIVVEEP